MSKALQGGATGRSVASREACRVVKVPPKGGERESRAPNLRVKAMEAVKILKVQPRGTPRRKGLGTFG